MRSQPDRRVVAVCGKGGAGKTVLTALMAKALVESGKAGRFLVVDADPALGLPGTLGIRVDRSIGQVRESIIEAAEQSASEDRRDIAGAIDYMVMQSLVETDDFAFLAMGRTSARGCYCSVNEILRDSLALLAAAFDTILIDGEAGLEQINRQVVGHLDTLLVVTDGSARARQSLEHIVRLVTEDRVIDCRRVGAVLNRARGGHPLPPGSSAGPGIETVATIPEDETIASYDMIGRPLWELPHDSPALAAVRALVSTYICA